MKDDVQKAMSTFRRPRKVHSLHVLGIIKRPDGTKAFIWHEE